MDVLMLSRDDAGAPVGFLAAMPGWARSAGLVAKLVSVFPGNHDRGLPSHQALIAVFDPATGAPVAIMDGTLITALRTAASAALACRVLSRDDARVLAIVGAGVQGDAHLRAVPRVRPFTEIRIASRDFSHARSLAAQHPAAIAVESFEAAVRGADVVCCCTDAPSPVLLRGWLWPGTHVSSVGASRLGPELDAATIAAASVFVESRIACSPPPAGAHELVGVDPASVTELGEVLLGLRPGRDSDASLTVWKSMGHAVEDAVAAHLVLSAARALGGGRLVAL
jgi:ornithine cyclodeaminase/alanine dehydrogenase-like protein (mu-crystallin family)